MKTLFKYLNSLIVILYSLVLFLPWSVQAINTSSVTIGVIRITTTDDAPPAPRTLAPNTPVNLYFALENTQYLGQTFNCSAAKKLHFILKHWSGSSYEFTAAQQSQYPYYAFNSGNQGQQNKYQAIFYCNADYLPGVQASVFQTNLNNLKSSTGQVWESAVWDKTTGAMPTAVISPAKQVYQPGDRMTLTIQNLPVEAATAKITINGKSMPAPALVSGPKSFPLTIGDADGFKAEGDNSVKIELFTVTGQAVVLGNSTFTIKSGAAPADGGGGGGAAPPAGGGGGGGTTPPGTSPTAECTKEKADAGKCLYNPLPQDELTKMFLFMARGFMTIVGIWGVMFIIVGGFRLVTAAGNEEQLIAAKKTIIWAILGVAVAIMSFSIIAIVQNFVTDKEIMEVKTNN